MIGIKWHQAWKESRVDMNIADTIVWSLELIWAIIETKAQPKSQSIINPQRKSKGWGWGDAKNQARSVDLLPFLARRLKGACAWWACLSSTQYQLAVANHASACNNIHATCAICGTNDGDDGQNAKHLQ